MANHKEINPSGYINRTPPVASQPVATRDDGPLVGQWQPDALAVDLTEPNHSTANQRGLSDLNRLRPSGSAPIVTLSVHQHLPGITRECLGTWLVHISLRPPGERRSPGPA